MYIFYLVVININFFLDSKKSHLNIKMTDNNTLILIFLIFWVTLTTSEKTTTNILTLPVHQFSFKIVFWLEFINHKSLQF